MGEDGSGDGARTTAPPVRLVVWDLDGVLTEVRSIWDHLLRTLGHGDACDANKELYFSGKINYQRWAELDVALMRGTPRERLEALVADIPLTPGAREAVAAVTDAGAENLIISSGLNVLAERVSSELSVPYITNRLNYRDGLVDGVEVVCSLDNKGELLTAALDERGLGPADCAAVGDARPDIPMLQVAGHPIAFRAHDEEVLAVCSQRTDDMAELAAMLSRLCSGGGDG
ncbi:MAG: HAD family phosphatase [Candidatus Undinarchaeales archaeon]|nr:HAD family phosphatase [Candidatus Undinarchaeales archaeon]MDP7491364.1 HAD family phosphatase [Candidatus Undinarchaeales archaeon]